MIVVTHEIAFAEEVATQVVFMDGGVVVEKGTSNELFYHPKEEKIENAEGECKSLQDEYYEIDFEDFELKVVQEEIEKTGYDEPSLMGIVAATAAYSEGGEWFDEAKEYIWENILYAENYIRDHSPKIKVIKPEGSYLPWLDFGDLDLPDEEINHRILQKAKVWLDNGTMFGAEGEKFQRINCATPREILKVALERICKEFKD